MKRLRYIPIALAAVPTLAWAFQDALTPESAVDSVRQYIDQGVAVGLLALGMLWFWKIGYPEGMKIIREMISVMAETRDALREMRETIAKCSGPKE